MDKKLGADTKFEVDKDIGADTTSERYTITGGDTEFEIDKKVGHANRPYRRRDKDATTRYRQGDILIQIRTR